MCDEILGGCLSQFGRNIEVQRRELDTLRFTRCDHLPQFVARGL